MIPRGTIRKVGDYYYSNPEYRKEIFRGLKEFFGENIPDNDEPLFNEWMTYDFIFSDGKRMLEKFYEENPLSIPLYRREIYKTLLENYYGLFEVTKVVPLKSLSLRRLSDKKEFDVSEVSATMDLEVGDVFVTRVAKIIDHYQLVGADGKAIKSSQSKSKKERDIFINNLSLAKMDTPKDSYVFYKVF